MYVSTRETTPFTEETLREGAKDWIDANLAVIISGTKRVLTDGFHPEHIQQALAILSAADQLTLHRQSGLAHDLEPALWEMMRLMLMAGQLDTDLAFFEPVREKATRNAGNESPISDPDIVEALESEPTLEAAEAKLGISVRQITRRIPSATRSQIRRAKKQKAKKRTS